MSTNQQTEKDFNIISSSP
jgi:hypothetical protein